MNEEQEIDLLTLIDDEGKEHEFEILDVMEYEERCYYALLPTFSDPEGALDAETYYIFEAIEENGEEQLAEVEDDELLDKLAEIFESRFDEMFESEDEISE